MVSTEEKSENNLPSTEEMKSTLFSPEGKGLLARAESELEDSLKAKSTKSHLVDSLAAIDPELAYQVALKESKRAASDYFPTELEFSSDLDKEHSVKNSKVDIHGNLLDCSLSVSESRKLKPSFTYETEAPDLLNVMRWEPQELEVLIPFFNWEDFAQEWQKSESESADLAIEKARKMLSQWCEEWRDLNGLAPRPCGVFAFFPAGSTSDDLILVFSNDRQQEEPLLKIVCFRQNTKDQDGYCRSLADFIAPMKEEFYCQRKGATDWIGFFAVTAGEEIEQIIRFHKDQNDSQQLFLAQLLAKHLVKAASYFLHDLVRREYWGYEKKSFTPEELFSQKQQGRIFLPTSKTLPDPALLKSIFNLISVKARTGIALLPNYEMKPEGSICGLYVAHPHAQALRIAPITYEQIDDYASRIKEDPEIIRKRLEPYC